MLFHFDLTIYNSAGEAVRSLTLSNASAIDPATDFGIDKLAFASMTGQGAVISAGGQVFPWDGDNDSGQFLKSGVFYVKLEYTDPFGHVEAITKEVTVLVPGQVYSVLIFNSAGEVVKELKAGISGNNAPSHIEPDKPSIAVGAGGGPAGQLSFDLGNGSSVLWDGSNSLGQAVSSGNYTAQLVVSHGGAPKSVASAAVAVLNVNEGLLDGAILAPNPLNLLDGTAGGAAILRLNVPAGVKAVGRVYNMAGELVISAANGQVASELRFDLGGRGLSSGVYLLAVTVRAPWGSIQRRDFKLVMIR